MNKLKLTSILVLILLLLLAYLSNETSKLTSIHNKQVDRINKQKAYTQTISKEIFYTYRDKSRELLNTDKKDTFTNIEFDIQKLWDDFFISVKRFKKLHSVASMYSDIILKDIVKDIYNKNINLVMKFDMLIKNKKELFNSKLDLYTNIQYSIFLILTFLLFYLLFEIRDKFIFIQKFISSSQNIISNSTIKDLKPIELQTTDKLTEEAKNNFNTLLDNINTSVKQSSKSLVHSYSSLELVEQNIEQLFDFVYQMQNEKNMDKEFAKKEDIIIQLLEELTSSEKKLQKLKEALDNLIDHKKEKIE